MIKTIIQNAIESDEYPDNIESTLRELEFDMTATLVRDEFDGQKGKSVWNVCVIRHGNAMTVEYSHGCAYRHYPNGKRINNYWHGRLTVQQLERNKRTKPDKPKLVDVIHAIVSDTLEIAAGSSYEQWAREFGYDVDSRTAEKCYDACCDEYFGLNRLGLTDDNLYQLSELYQDY